MHFLDRDCETEIGNIFTQLLMQFLNEKKMETPDWRQMKELSKNFEMV